MLSRFILLCAFLSAAYQAHGQRIVIRSQDSTYVNEATSRRQRPVLTRFAFKTSVTDILVAGDFRIQTEATVTEYASLYGGIGSTTYATGQIGGLIFDGYYPSDWANHRGFGWVYSLGARCYPMGEALDDYGFYFDLGIVNRKYLVNQDILSGEFNEGTLYQFDRRLEFGWSLIDDHLAGDLYFFIGRRNYSGTKVGEQQLESYQTEEYGGFTTSFGAGLRIGYTGAIFM